MHKKNIILVFLCILSGTFFAQSTIEEEQHQIDSISNANRHITDALELVDNYNYLAYLYGMISLDSSEHYLTLAKQKALANNYSKGLALNYAHMARVNMQKVQYDEAVACFDSSIVLLDQLGDSALLLDSYMGLCYVYAYQSSQLNSLEYAKKALPLALAFQDSVRLSLIYNNIASFYYKIDEFDNAYKHFKNSIDIDEKLNTGRSSIALTYSNLGMLLVRHDKYDEAEQIYHGLIEMLPDIERVDYRIILNLSVASYFMKTGKLEESKSYLDKVPSLLDMDAYKQLEVRYLRNLAEWHLHSAFYKESIAYYNKCLDLQNEFGIEESLIEIYEKIAEAYSKLKDYEQAYSYMQKSKEASIQNDSKRIVYFLSEFEGQKEKLELKQQLLNDKIEKERLEHVAHSLRMKYFSLILLVVFLISIIVFVYIGWHRTSQNSKKLHTMNGLIEEQKSVLEKNVKDLRDREKELKQYNIAKDKFLSLMAHDLRSPFNSLIGFSDLMLGKIKSGDTSKLLSYATLINGVSKSALSLLNDLLEWASLQLGKVDYHPEKVLVNKYFKSILNNLQQIEPDRRLDFKTNLDDSFEILLDKTMIQSVVRNLITNALKYTPKMGSIGLSLSKNASSMVLSIKDEGIGMSQEQIGKLFKIEDAESTKGLKEEKGTGLGLILCKDFVDRHKGSIKVKSEEGVGTEFSVFIPLR